MKQPKTWPELLNAGYVVELTEEQIAIAKHKLNPLPDFKFRTPDEDSENLHNREMQLRARREV